MDLTLFQNLDARRISLNEAKSILNGNGNAYSEEDVARILDYLHAVAELAAEHVEHQKESGQIQIMFE